ncbi:MAG: TolC family protein [Tenacibaculum sp.]
MMKIKFLKISVIAIGLISGIARGQMQENYKHLTEQDAVKLALSKSVMLKKSKLAIDKSNTEILGAIALNPISIQYQDVGVLPGLNEKELSVIQNFGSLLGHIQNKKAALALKKLAISNNNLSKKETVRKTKSLYQQWNYLYGLLSLVEEQQQNSKEINKIAKQLHSAGEIGGLENDVTELQFLGVQSEKNRIYKEFTQTENELKELLLINYNIQPTEKFPAKKMIVNNNKDSISELFFSLFNKKNKLAQKNIAVAKSSYFPEFNAGLVNRKTGSSSSFTGFNIGLNIPISMWSNKAKTSKQKIIKEEVSIENQAAAIAIRNNFNSLQEQIYYLNKELSDIDKTVSTATNFINKLQLAYKSGEIDAYQYSQSFDAYFQVMQNYLSLINNYNQTVIEYEFYKEN